MSVFHSSSYRKSRLAAGPHRLQELAADPAQVWADAPNHKQYRSIPHHGYRRQFPLQIPDCVRGHGIIAE